MVHADPRFDRIARRLGVLELRADDDGIEADGVHDRGDDDGALVRSSRLFVNYYSEAGLRRAIEEYGLDALLLAQGLADWDLRVSSEDPFRHRLEIVLSDGRRVMDLRLHLRRISLPGIVEHADVVVVDWLLMQNPRRAFSSSRPRLPGQEHPGTGAGRVVHNLLLVLCERIEREALVVVPEHWHLAALYRRAGYVPVDADFAARLDAYARAGDDAGLSFARLSWAIEWQCIVDERGARVPWTPAALVAPVSRRLERALSPGGFLHIPWPSSRIRPRFFVDVAALHHAEGVHPVDGLHAGR